MLRLMLVTDDALLAGRDVLEVATAAVRGGVTCVQLRLKHRSPRDLSELARRLIAQLDVPVLINDRLDVALAVGAAGVHLGVEDLPVELARRAAPPGFLVGASVGSLSEVLQGRGADYWGVGPWRVTQTKADAGEAIGATGLRDVVAAAGGTPCVAIGGIQPSDVAQAHGAGAVGVAVASGILGATDVEGAARSFSAPGGGPL